MPTTLLILRCVAGQRGGDSDSRRWHAPKLHRRQKARRDSYTWGTSMATGINVPFHVLSIETLPKITDRICANCLARSPIQGWPLPHLKRANAFARFSAPTENNTLAKYPPNLRRISFFQCLWNSESSSPGCISSTARFWPPLCASPLFPNRALLASNRLSQSE